jgi:hypothetical protein
MNNPEKLATFGTQRHMTNKNKNKTQHRKKMSTTHTTKTTLNPDAREQLAVPTSYTVTNIDKSCKNLSSDRGKKKIYVEGKQSIAI